MFFLNVLVLGAKLEVIVVERPSNRNQYTTLQFLLSHIFLIRALLFMSDDWWLDFVSESLI